MPDNIDYDKKVIVAKVEGITISTKAKRIVPPPLPKASVLFASLWEYWQRHGGLNPDEHITATKIHRLIKAIEGLSVQEAESLKSIIETLEVNKVLKPDETWQEFLKAAKALRD
jgi:hypothetical protein